MVIVLSQIVSIVITVATMIPEMYGSMRASIEARKMKRAERQRNFSEECKLELSEIPGAEDYIDVKRHDSFLTLVPAIITHSMRTSLRSRKDSRMRVQTVMIEDFDDTESAYKETDTPTQLVFASSSTVPQSASHFTSTVFFN